MTYEDILVEETENICLIRIHRPYCNNKLSINCMEEIKHVLDKKSRDTSCHCFILAGGEDFFSSGGELGDYRKKDTLEIKEFGNAFINLHKAIKYCPKPVIAAVEGHAFGGGFSLVEACDLAIAAESALFAVPEILDGLAPAMGLSGIYSQLTKKEVMSLGLLGTNLTAQQALEHGLVNYVVPKKDVINYAVELGKSFKDKNPAAVRLFKELYSNMGFLDYERRLHLGEAMMVALLKSNEGMEVLSAKEENREPVWKNQ